MTTIERPPDELRKIALRRRAKAEWKGDLVHGSGRLTVGSGALDVPYSVKSRFEDGRSATNPEELLGAAHAGCFTMALAARLSGAQFAPTHIHTDANVAFEKIGDAFAITGIELVTSADVPDIGFTMALAARLSGAQFAPTHIHTNANVAFEKIGDAFAITGIELVTSADVPDIDDATFQKFVADAKQTCPVSKALAAIEIRVKATLEQTARSRSSTQIATANRDNQSGFAQG